MTRDEFMEEAQKEIDQVFHTPKARLMNLVMKAWAEGKKNAEMDRVDSFCNDIFDSFKKKLEEDSSRITIDPPQIGKISATDICTAIEKDKMNVSDEIMSAIGGLRDKEVYNACCDNHIKIIHDMMTGVKPIDGQE